MDINIDKWVDNEQKKHRLCACGCGKEIIIKPRQKYYGIPKYFRGHSPCSDETKHKLSIAHTGKTFTDEHIHNLKTSHMGNPGFWTGKKRPELSEKRKGKNNPAWGIKQSTETILKRIKRGDEHYNWQGGITPQTRRRTRGIFWKRTADKIRLRDDNTCIVCGHCGDDNKLPVHHIIPFKISKNNNSDNLITVCQSCHIKLDKEFNDCNSKANYNKNWHEIYYMRKLLFNKTETSVYNLESELEIWNYGCFI